MAKAINSKACLMCGRILPLGAFYTNAKWKEQKYHDAYCKECYQQMCKDEESVEEYFNSNNRKWNHELWEISAKRAQSNLSTNAQYLRGNPSEKVKMLDAATIRIIPSVMNLNKCYQYADGQHLKDLFELEREKVVEERKAAKAVYSPIWRGNFTAEQIQSMDAMYEQYEKDFDLSTVSRRDYVRKLIKASMNADIAEDKLRHGQITVTEYRDLNKIYDDLAKSSAIAEASRKAGGTTALNSLGNIILGLEINHHLDINPYHFPEDDVDTVYNDYAHLATAVGAQL